jgi:hypothetical protein
MNTLLVILVSVVAFAIVIAAMAVGVIFRGKCLRGSCGGEAIYGPDGDLLNCDSCPVRRDPDRLAREAGGTRVPTSK